MLTLSSSIPTTPMTNGKVQKSIARSRRRLAALTFLSNISLDGGSSTNTNNNKTRVNETVQEQHMSMVSCGVPLLNASTPELDTPSPQCSTGILSKFLEFDSLKHSIVTPFRERTNTSGSESERKLINFRKKLLSSHQSAHGGYLGAGGSLSDEKNHTCSSNESVCSGGRSRVQCIPECIPEVKQQYGGYLGAGGLLSDEKNHTCSSNESVCSGGVDLGVQCIPEVKQRYGGYLGAGGLLSDEKNHTCSSNESVCSGGRSRVQCIPEVKQQYGVYLGAGGLLSDEKNHTCSSNESVCSGGRSRVQCIPEVLPSDLCMIKPTAQQRFRDQRLVLMSGKSNLCSMMSSLPYNRTFRAYRHKKKSWMTDEILELMEERRINKGNQIEYRRIQNIIRKKIREAKEKEMSEKCEDIEYYQSKYDEFNVHKKVRELTGNIRKKCNKALISTEGSVIINTEDKKKEWKYYLEKLFHDNRLETPPVQDGESGPTIIEEEVRAAIKQLKNGKAAGPDEIQAEFLKLLDDASLKRLTQVFNKVYTSGRIPKEWLKSEFITLPKKATAKSCDDYRTISLMSHLLKLFLKIIHKRIYKLCEEQIAPNQFGFLNAVGTREALFSVQILFQRSRDVNCNVFACLIDYKKAFDRVKHEKMVDILEKIGIDAKDLNLITNLYWNQTAVLRVDGELTEEVKIQRGVRQGCIISPILFNIYSEQIFREALENIEEGIPINGVRVNNIRYADDTIIFADTLQGLQTLMDRVVEVSAQYGLEMNTSKTKLLIVSKENISGAHLYVNQSRIERVSQYTYLGTIINENWDNSQEIKCRIEKARAVFNRMRSAFTNHHLTLHTKVRLLRCYVFSVLLYGVETWTVNKETTARLEAFELWLYRRILKISWTQKVTNAEVLSRMRKKPEIVNTVKCRKLEYLGHIMRNEERYCLLQQILQGKINSRRGPGRRRISWLANLRQ
ncbi:hypothetical protein WDU94_008838 [Cyamophila willieti]